MKTKSQKKVKAPRPLTSSELSDSQLKGVAGGTDSLKKKNTPPRDIVVGSGAGATPHRAEG